MDDSRYLDENGDTGNYEEFGEPLILNMLALKAPEITFKTSVTKVVQRTKRRRSKQETVVTTRHKAPDGEKFSVRCLFDARQNPSM